MEYTKCLISVLMLAGSSAVHAEARDTIPAEPAQVPDYQWRIVTPDMTPNELTRNTSHNQRLLGNSLRTYSENLFTSLGMSRSEINILGTAVGLAVHDARYHLDDSKILALELRDIAEGERSLFFGINVDW